MFLSALLFASVITTAAIPALADGPVKIAFVDTGNTGRSVTAEALANVLIQERKLPVLVISRAVDLNPFYTTPEANFVTLLAARGIDVTAHRAAQVTANDIRHADVVFTMTDKHKQTLLAQFPDAAGKTYTLSEYTGREPHDVADAFGKPMEFYQDTLRQIDAFIPAVLDKLLAK